MITEEQWIEYISSLKVGDFIYGDKIVDINNIVLHNRKLSRIITEDGMWTWPFSFIERSTIENLNEHTERNDVCGV